MMARLVLRHVTLLVSFVLGVFSIASEPGCYASGPGDGFDVGGVPSHVYRLGSPTWTPDGQAFVFGAYRRADDDFSLYRNIFYLADDGRELFQWIPEGAPRNDDCPPYDVDVGHDMDPSGTYVAFSTLRHGLSSSALDRTALDIAIARLDGTGYQRLTETIGIDTGPAWSPDGKKIAFVSDRDRHVEGLARASFGVYVMPIDGSEAVRLAPTIHASPDNPVWSPDGTHIAFLGGDNLYYERLYIASTDGKRVYDLGKVFPGESAYRSMYTGRMAALPAWSPDGERIAFSQKIGSGTQGIYTTKADGSDRRLVARLSANTGSLVGETAVTSLAWSPDGTKLRFVGPPEVGSTPSGYAIYKQSAIYEY